MRKRKRIVKRRVFLVIVLGVLVLEGISAIILKRPLLAWKFEDDTKIVYQGLFYDSYDCQLCDNKRAIFKFSGYQCPESNHEKRAKLTLVGDLLFEYPYYDDIDAGTSKDLYFNQVKDYFENDDLSIANMEVPIDNGNLEISGEGYSFCAPRWVGDLVASLDFELLGTANNHANDRGVEGIDSTIDFFKNKSIMTVGTYKTKEDRKDFRILNINDIRFGFLAYTYETNVDPEYGEEYRVGYYSDPHTYEVTDEYKEIMQEEITQLRKECDVLIVMMHWGKEFTFEENDEQKDMAAFLNGLGVDLIVGSHSHNIQPIEMIGDKHKTLVYYSLGNFVSADEDLDRTYNDETFDNAYQVGMLSTLEVVLKQDQVSFENIGCEMIVNYFDDNSRNWELIPLANYTKEKEQSHQRYDLGLTREFIQNIYEDVIDKQYRK